MDRIKDTFPGGYTDDAGGYGQGGINDLREPMLQTLDAIEDILFADLEFDADDSGAQAHVVEKEDAPC